MKHRKLLVSIIFFAIPCLLWAEEPGLFVKTFNNFSGRLFLLLGGIIPGLILTIKFSAEMIKTYYSREQNPEAFKSAIIKFATAVFVIFNIVLITVFVFGDNNSAATGNLTSGMSTVLNEVKGGTT